MRGNRNDQALKSATGLEGGLVACGSTCGVVTVGALGIAGCRLGHGGEAAQRAVMDQARAYVDWFQGEFLTTLCRERTGVDFYKARGQLSYLLPARVGRCLWHIGKAADRLWELTSRPVSDAAKGPPEASSDSMHCATEVLKGVRESCGVGDEVLEKIVFVLDGGVALSGGVCGAMAGAILAANLAFGWDIRDMNYATTVKEFVGGHVNLLRKHPHADKPETFAIGKEIMQRLQEKTTVLECNAITGKKFSGWDDFQTHLRSSSACRELIRLAITTASDAIIRYKTREES